MKNKAKLFGMITGVILFVVMIVGLTYAYFTWQSSDTNITGTSECFLINYVNGQDISSVDLSAIDETEFINGNNITIMDGMALTTVSIGIDSSCDVNGNASIMITPSNISSAFTTGNSIGSLKYAVVPYSSDDYPNVTLENLIGESFSILSNNSITSEDSFVIHSDNILSGNTYEYIIIFYLDEVLVNNDAITAIFEGIISAEAIQIYS